MQIRAGTLHEPFDQTLLCARRRNDKHGFYKNTMKHCTILCGRLLPYTKKCTTYSKSSTEHFE